MGIDMGMGMGVGMMGMVVVEHQVVDGEQEKKEENSIILH